MKTPVALVIFNRPDTTEKVFEAIRRAKPPKLFVIADGPRVDRPKEAEKCAASRAIIKRVDWDCEVIENYSDINLGCGRRIASGLSWVFEQVEQAIILEDDCLPAPSFFRFCDELLEKYQDDERIMTIGGYNGLGKWKSNKQSYHFSFCPVPWGWASWSRAWRYFDYDIKAWADREVKQQLKKFIANDFQYREMAKNFEKAYRKEKGYDFWGYQWFFAVMANSGLTILPSVNLISNIGFGSNATHLKSSHSVDANSPLYSLQFPLKHNDSVRIDRYFDRKYMERKRGKQPLIKKVQQKMLHLIPKFGF
ncbi:glycosyltransferase family 2 protein [Pleurocapsales cyanobacterium LEGE 06147]|nr:glycosyltransferase family 2 protein [Pleurocapsales cyanobacterium LEGE 06147]